VSALAFVVNHKDRVPIFTFGVRSTKLLLLTLTPGLTVTLVEPAGIPTDPLTRSNLNRPLPRIA
jgi:hypothetical protein